MKYYFAKTIGLPFKEAIARIKAELQNEGFGVLTEIDVRAVLKQKLDVDVHNYHILGACHPRFAYEALEAENKIGTMLPCNVIVQETEKGTEVAAIDPVQSMAAVDNPKLAEIAKEIRGRLKRVIERL